ncbi:hypothetical protein C7E17_27405, partial [Stenotrophomonas maltophilia]
LATICIMMSVVSMALCRRGVMPAGSRNVVVDVQALATICIMMSVVSMALCRRGVMPAGSRNVVVDV